MIALFVRAFRHLATRLGRTAGVAVTAVTASSGLMAMPAPALTRPATSHTAPDTVGQRAASTWSVEAASLAIVAPIAGHYETLASASADTRGVGRSAVASVATSGDTGALHRMPGWLAAQAKRQAGLIGQTQRPLHRAASRKPRAGNRPARRPQPPKPTAARKVVWLSGRSTDSLNQR